MRSRSAVRVDPRNWGSSSERIEGPPAIGQVWRHARRAQNRISLFQFLSPGSAADVLGYMIRCLVVNAGV